MSTITQMANSTTHDEKQIHDEFSLMHLQHHHPLATIL